MAPGTTISRAHCRRAVLGAREVGASDRGARGAICPGIVQRPLPRDSLRRLRSVASRRLRVNRKLWAAAGAGAGLCGTSLPVGAGAPVSLRSSFLKRQQAVSPLGWQEHGFGQPTDGTERCCLDRLLHVLLVAG